MFSGILNSSILFDVITLLIMTHITVIGVTIYLHRCQAHRALELNPIISHFLRFWLWLTTGMLTKEWVAIHRKHHSNCEQDDDPHSPVKYGILRVLFGGVGLYRKAKDPETIERYGNGTPNDFMERIYTRVPYGGVLALAVIDLLLFGIPGVVMWAVQMVWIPFFGAGVINGIGHYFGYRNTNTPDQSRNVVPFGILLGGEELHNNHHAYPTSAKFSMKWWEFDLSWLYIRLLSVFGLARPTRYYSRKLGALKIKDMGSTKANCVRAEQEA